MKKLTIAVTGLNNTDNPGPGVPVIRSLRDSKRFDVRIIGLVYENLEPGIYMDGIADKIYNVPFPSAGTDVLLQRIEYINSKENIDILIPNFDAELYSFIKSADKLKKMNIKTFLPDLETFESRHKSNLEKFGEKTGIKIPKSKTIFNASDIYLLSNYFQYPLLVKGKFYDAYVCYNPEQVLSQFNKLSSKWGLPVIIQEFIQGTEVNVIALGDGKGNTIAAVPMRKQYITDKGKAWAGITLSDNYMLELTEKVISGSKWKGGLEIEIIKTENNEYYVIEINPRIPAWVYLATGAGQNIPEALVRLILGEKVEPYNNYEVGKMFVRYSYDIITDIEKFQQLAISGEL